MRDMYVQIPGYRDNKLNSAYGKGGVDLLYETIAKNFDIRLDGCAKVNFKNFQKIIDALGGLELTLKENEAKYLNTTNYISIKKYRNVRAGKHLLNGNQVMGYVRVRHTSTITGKNDDYGRTDRQRIVLNAIYEKCKNMSKPDLLNLMIKFLHMITTDIDRDCFEMMLNSFIDMGMNTKDIQQLRIPADHTFKDNIKVRGMSVLIPDLDANIKVLHNFIFSDQVEPTKEPKSSSTKTGTNK
jgi:LCP family protein required for cell wall assembly